MIRTRSISGVVDSLRMSSPARSATSKSSSVDSLDKLSSTLMRSSRDGAMHPGQSCPGSPWGTIFPR